MNDLNPTAAVSSLKHLTSQSLVSLELGGGLEPSLEGINELEIFDTDRCAVDALLIEMTEIRQILQESLQDLFAICE